jgi:GrpB-like predicted nucleotidyltransferase (UPF0157 family)
VRRPLRLADYDPAWPQRFAEIAGQLRDVIPDGVLRIDHIGSTAVPGLAAKDVIDIQITIDELAEAEAWPDELLPGLVRQPQNNRDHVPDGASDDDAEWTKQMWSRPQSVHLHVREAGRANQRYALLVRDFLRADRLAAGGYERLKRALALHAPDDWDAYYAVKDPACDLILSGAEQWALRTHWNPGDSDG